MWNELGQFALVTALFVALAQAAVPLIGAQRRWYGWMELARPAALVQFALLAFAFVALARAFVVSDFSVRIVYQNSHTLQPLLYRITGTWGNHEGSMLLWVLILSLFGAAVAVFGGSLRPTLRARALAVMGLIALAFLAFILFTSNPFDRLEPAPIEGRSLNALLQDPGLAFHPPFLYLGYVGLSTAYAFAVAALIEGRVDAAWARWVRPWTLAAWLFLTIGIALGSWWAYYELGWGGFWFWDPVENASFVPWLVAAALLHSAIVVEKREALKSWTVLLAILAFSFSLTGTFIVRSGVLTSVHAFANDPERGVFILAILAVAVGGSLTLYAARAQAMVARGVFAPVSREGGLVLNNLLLVVSAGVVFLGTVWPLLAEAFGHKVSVGAPFFDMAFTPFFVALATILPPAAMLPWKRGDLRAVLGRLWGVAVLSVALGALAWSVQTGKGMLAPIGTVLGAWVALGAAVDLLERAGMGRGRGVRAVLGRLIRLPGADWGKALGHAGLGITIFAVAAVTAWEVERILTVREGESFALGPYEIRLEQVETGVQGPNYTATVGHVAVLRGGETVARLAPEKRVYVASRMPTTEAALDIGVFRDVYVVIGDPQKDGSWAVRAYIKPFANWIWGGGIIMALGGLASLLDRRWRVAAGARRRAPAGAVAAE
ncbi:MAG: heme lyase CcmF/NrfE family subunit [Alphaproteobacteria bacterium]|nr:MAG: heme lyase CcmF/NrfE family subunit [Alphaproteobacteria bacterium]